MFLRHLVHWPSIGIRENFTEIVPGERIRRGGLNARAVAKYSDFGPIEGYRFETVQDRGKVVLITNWKFYMSFRLVPKSVTLNDLEQLNSPYFALFHQIRYLPGRIA